MGPLSRYSVLGVEVNCLTLGMATDHLIDAASRREHGYTCVCPVHSIMEALDDADYQKVMNQSMMTTADGMPVVWMGRWLTGEKIQRVYGPDLMEAVFQHTENTELSHYFYGGHEGVADQLIVKVKERFPELSIAGYETPPFHEISEEELSALSQRVKESGAHFLWVGLGVPKQERFMARAESSLPGIIQIGVGAAFDFLSGNKPQAPQWMQRSGLEWLFRLFNEPKRLARRYLVGNVRFLWHITLQLTGIRRYPLS
ncbi:WecB/TagA/CpsF family glycosyltransferase [Rubellicoccus peritrichatus]|uniref:WecB/TagA/CpsF family glycosyltransferase n=1 Tax=Rubellicoccus peritrichatus TaxID=3080537 RepID=A0AAQ3L5I7_9BACT|nr:WecB/TagA/CpsF family glycosyltransferase [Puniceicoccus sp. CR14]WOO39575.1 WecB/TagA/CpsF family glycosyltransferase [Puniceicoccus sp. CR14]